MTAMAKRRRIVAEVHVVSLNDERLADRTYHNGRKGVDIFRLPTRAIYFVEGCGVADTERKALTMAAADGIGAAEVKLWIDTRCPAHMRPDSLGLIPPSSLPPL